MELFSNRLPLSGKIGFAIVAVHTFLALAGPWMTGPVNYIDLSHALLPPSCAHPFGTDENGVDLLAAVVAGTRPGFMTALITVLLGLIIGGSLGAASGYLGGWFDTLLMRLVDVIFSFPGLLLNIYVLSLVKNPSYFHMIVALTLTSWAGFARLARGQAAVISRQPFIRALETMGASRSRIIFFHVLPNVAPVLVVQSTFYFGVYLLVEAGLSFLGVAPQSEVSWGLLIQQGTRYLLAAPHIAFFPGLFLGIAVLGVNLAGDALRDVIS